MTSRSRSAIQHTFAAIGTIVLAGLVADLVLWPRDSLPPVADVPVSRYFTAAFVNRADEFRGPQSWLGIASLLVLVIVPLVIALRWPRATLEGSWTGRWANRWVDRRSGAAGGRGGVIGCFVIGAAITSVTLLAALPFEIAAFARARNYGLAVQSYGGWLWDWLLASAMIVVTVALLAVLAGFLVRRLKRFWWPVFGFCLIALAFAYTLLAPVVIAPLFGDFTELPAGQTRDDVTRLAGQSGVKAGEIYVVDAARRTTGANAYVTGLGSTKRVVLYDTLLKDFTRDEREQVVAHELGHAHYHDLLAGLMWFAFVALASLFAVDLLARVLADRRGVDIASPAGIAMLLAAMIVAVALSQPAANALSRKVEARADAFALQLTAEPEAAIALEQRLTVNNVARPDPPALLNLVFGTHPTPIKRIGMAVTVRREIGPPTVPIERVSRAGGRAGD